MGSEEKVPDAIADQAIEEQSNKNDLPATYEPPLNSPLTGKFSIWLILKDHFVRICLQWTEPYCCLLIGCYLLIILGEPHSQQHKDIILQRLLKGNLIRYFPLLLNKWHHHHHYIFIHRKVKKNRTQFAHKKNVSTIVNCKLLWECRKWCIGIEVEM